MMNKRPAISAVTGDPGLGHAFGVVHYVSNVHVPKGFGVGVARDGKVLYVGLISQLPPTLPEGSAISVHPITYREIVKALEAAGAKPMARMA